jgi:hypothetical protein
MLLAGDSVYVTHLTRNIIDDPRQAAFVTFGYSRAAATF